MTETIATRAALRAKSPWLASFMSDLGTIKHAGGGVVGLANAAVAKMRDRCRMTDRADILVATCLTYGSTDAEYTKVIAAFMMAASVERDQLGMNRSQLLKFLAVVNRYLP